MSKVYAQKLQEVFSWSGSLLSGCAITSGSFYCGGYSRIVGQIISSGSMTAGSGVKIDFSPDSGSNFDYGYSGTLSACGASAYSIEVVGNVGKITLTLGASNAAILRAWFAARPIT